MPRDDVVTYEAEMGRPPTRLPDDHPDLWQWEYRGTKAQCEEMLERLFQQERAEAYAHIEGQESFEC